MKKSKMKCYISSKSGTFNIVEFKKTLEDQFEDNSENILMEIEKSNLISRGVDPTIIVATVGALSTALGALITGILQVIKHSSIKKIIIQSKGGSRLEVPADITEDQLDILIDKVKKLDANDLKIYLP